MTPFLLLLLPTTASAQRAIVHIGVRIGVSLPNRAHTSPKRKVVPIANAYAEVGYHVLVADAWTVAPTLAVEGGGRGLPDGGGQMEWGLRAAMSANRATPLGPIRVADVHGAVAVGFDPEVPRTTSGLGARLLYLSVRHVHLSNTETAWTTDVAAEAGLVPVSLLLGR